MNLSQGVRPTRRRGVSTTIVRCGTCGLVYADPQPIPSTFEQHYGTSPEEYWQAHDLADEPCYFDGQIENFLRLWSGTGQPRALDIGAGVGKAMRKLAQRGFDTFGLEPSRPFVDAALERGGIPPDRLVCESVESASYPPRSFDFIAFAAVVEHLYDPAAVIERTIGWCAPGGLVHIEVPSSQWLINRLVNLAYRLQGLDYCANISPMHVPYHLYEFTLESFRRHGQRAGYEVAEWTRYVADTLLPKPLARPAARVMEATGTGMQLAVWLRAT